MQPKKVLPDSETENSQQTAGSNWHIQLFRKSVLKQRKLQELRRAIGRTEAKVCLDLGSDNGVISYFLRQEGGKWSSADLTEQAVTSIRSLVENRVFLTDGKVLPFSPEEFDIVVIVDMLEHVEDDRLLLKELARIIKPGGRLILNVPNLKKHSPLRAFRHLIGQTDEAHGHLRPGYSALQLQTLVEPHFEMRTSRTYSRFFSELIDTAIVFAYALLRGKERHEEESGEISKGLVVTGKEMEKFKKRFKIFSAIFPFVWLFSKLDLLIPFTSGFMRISTVSRTTVEE